MHLIIGPRYMGKRNYAKKLYGSFENYIDLEEFLPDEFSDGLITNLQAGVKTLLEKKIDPLDFFAERIEKLRCCVLIGDEIGGGVVPVDEFEREWRSSTGRLYQYLASEAEIVDRIFAGLPLRLKPSCTVRDSRFVEAGFPSGQPLILRANVLNEGLDAPGFDD